MDEKDRTKQELKNRLRSTQGHMQGIARMLDDDAPCIDIVRQLLAVRGAMRAIQRQLWRLYLGDGRCGLRSDNSEERALAGRELQELLKMDGER